MTTPFTFRDRDGDTLSFAKATAGAIVRTDRVGVVVSAAQAPAVAQELLIQAGAAERYAVVPVATPHRPTGAQEPAPKATTAQREYALKLAVQAAVPHELPGETVARADAFASFLAGGPNG